VTALSQWPTTPNGVLGFLVAQVMKQAGKGKPNPKLVNAMLARGLSSIA